MPGTNIALGSLEQRFYTLVGVLATFSLNLNLATAQVLLTMPSDLKGIALFVIIRDSTIDLTASAETLTLKIGSDIYAVIGLGLTPIANSQIAILLPSTVNGLNEYSAETVVSAPKVIPASGTMTGTLGNAIGVGTLKADIIGYMIP